MNKNAEKFLQYATIEMLKKSVSLNIKNSKRVDDCNGYFCGETKEFAVAIGKPQKLWLPVFVHEFCHFEQWREDSDIWDLSMNDSGVVDIWSWLEGAEEYPKKQIEKSFYITQLLEQDCDKRVVEKIGQFDLPIDPERYIKASNAYHLFYQVALQERTWYVDAPYQVEKIIDAMPSKFLRPSELKKKNPEFINSVLKNCKLKKKQPHGPSG
jgi:hypothetical protein